MAWAASGGPWWAFEGPGCWGAAGYAPITTGILVSVVLCLSCACFRNEARSGKFAVLAYIRPMNRCDRIALDLGGARRNDVPRRRVPCPHQSRPCELHYDQSHGPQPDPTKSVRQERFPARPPQGRHL